MTNFVETLCEGGCSEAKGLLVGGAQLVFREIRKAKKFLSHYIAQNALTHNNLVLDHHALVLGSGRHG
jgi:hypothetical protein